VFCRTKRSADQVASTLTTKGFAAAAIHGDLGQSQRERAMRAFRSGKVDVLVATEVAARGLDVEDVTHVINYECPEDEKAYLHRIGRTGRAGREGVAVTFVDWNDLHRWKTINDTLHLGFEEPLETYSTSEHLYSALGIPTGASGVLPRGQRARLGLEAESLEDIGETGKTRSRAASPDRRSHSASPAGHDRRAGASTDAARDAGTRSQRSRRRTRSGQLPDSAGPGREAAVSESGEVRSDATGHAAGNDANGAGSVAVASSSTAAGGADGTGQARRRPRRRRSSPSRPADQTQTGQQPAASAE
jgi:superfamily II DNA/RNA helicase